LSSTVESGAVAWSLQCHLKAESAKEALHWHGFGTLEQAELWDAGQQYRSKRQVEHQQRRT
jgi:hypothetical protein